MKKLLATLLIMSTLLVGCDEVPVNQQYLNSKNTINYLSEEWNKNSDYVVYVVNKDNDYIESVGSYEWCELCFLQSLVPLKTETDTTTGIVKIYSVWVDQINDKTVNEWNELLNERLGA